MFWRLHRAVFDTQLEKATSIILGYGDEVQVVDGPLRDLAPAPTHLTTPSLAITTLQDARAISQLPEGPRAFYHPERYRVSYWSTRLPQSVSWLNSGGIFLPYAYLLDSPSIIHTVAQSSQNDTPRVFIRPDSGNKTFTGFDIAVGDHFTEELKAQMHFSRPEPETLCYVAPYRSMEATEWRFWICEHKVVAHTPYCWGDQLENTTINPNIPPAAIQAMAERLAQSNFAIDYAYTADFAIDLNDHQPYLIEINAASTSGVYEAKLDSLLLALRSTAVRDYNMEIDE